MPANVVRYDPSATLQAGWTYYARAGEVSPIQKIYAGHHSGFGAVAKIVLSAKELLTAKFAKERREGRKEDTGVVVHRVLRGFSLRPWWLRAFAQKRVLVQKGREDVEDAKEDKNPGARTPGL